MDTEIDRASSAQMDGGKRRIVRRRAFVGSLVGWFLPVIALQASVLLAIWIAFADKSDRKTMLILLLSIVLPAALHLFLTLPTTAELAGP